MDKQINVSDFDIASDGQSPCAQKLNKLFSSTAGKFYFDKGIYLIEETLKVPSRTHLELHPEAILKLADGSAKTENDYLLTNANPDAGDEGISINGGIFEGNQNNNPRATGLLDFGYTGAMLHFENVRNLKLTNIKLNNAEAYYSRFTAVHHFHIEGIQFHSDNIRKNNDGIHLGGNCSNGVIRKISSNTPGVTGDDLVALNADDASQRTEVRGMQNGNIENIQIEDLRAHSCHTFVRLLCVTSTIRNISIKNVEGGCKVAAINADGARGCRVPLFDDNNPPYPNGVGNLEHIKAANFRVYKASYSKHALVSIQERASDLSITNFHRLLEKDVAHERPTVGFKYMQIENGTLNGDPIEGMRDYSADAFYENHCPTIELNINSSSMNG